MVMALTFFSLMPELSVVLLAIILQRSGAYGIMKPPTDWLFTGLSDAIKYKFKNFLDTVVYRGGDVFAQLVVVRTLVIFSKDLRVLSLVGVLLSVVWVWNAVTVGRLAIKKFNESHIKDYPVSA